MMKIIGFAFVIATIGLAGCGRQAQPVVSPPPPPPLPPSVEAPPPAPPPAPAEAPPAPPAATTLSEEEAFARMSVDALNASAPLPPVFFSYDSTTLSEEARNVLAATARWMNRWTTTIVAVEGHADERGTAEYNLALGDERSRAVRDYLVALGVDASRLRALSKGKEQPFCVGTTESCWSQNRRGHFVVIAK